MDEKIDAGDHKAAAALCGEVIANLKGRAEGDDHDNEQMITMQEKLIAACESVLGDADASSQAKLEATIQRLRAKASLITLVDDSYDLDEITGEDAAIGDLAFI